MLVLKDKLRKLLRLFIGSQVVFSNWFDKVLPDKFRVDGYKDFAYSVIPRYLKQESTIFEVGGGKNPYTTVELKRRLRATVIGLDIDENELRTAPRCIYDKIIVVDITKYKGNGEADCVLCLAVLEHVRDVEAALQGIASCLKKGGYACIFVPSRNALYAQINRILPERLKKIILFSLFPHMRETHGFPAYYDRCTPRDIKSIAKQVGFEVVKERHYYTSSYFSFFFPLYLAWRLYLLLFYAMAREQAAETFGVVLKKTNENS